MKLSPLEQKMLMNIQLGVICAEMVGSVDMVTYCTVGVVHLAEIKFGDLAANAD